MINTAGEYILIIIVTVYGSHGPSASITSERVDSFEACKAAQVQLEPLGSIKTYCIAAEVIE